MQKHSHWPITAVCTRAMTGGKGTRGAVFWASAPGNTMFVDAEVFMMLTPTWCYQCAEQYCSMNSPCCTGSTRVTSLTFTQVLLSCTGGSTSQALACFCSSIIPWSSATILWDAASPVPSMPPAPWRRRAARAGSAGAGKGLSSHTLPQTLSLWWPNAFLQGFCQH